MAEKLVIGPRVLIVSNQQTTGPLWVFSLQQQDLHVMLEADPSKTLQRCEMETPDLIILDINLPEAQTVDLIKSLRAEMTTPILLLTPPRSEENIIEVYKAGVDDYMSKPVSPSLFNAKVKVWLRRSWSATTNTLDPVKIGGMHVFPAERLVIRDNGQPVHLTNLELRLLYYLISRAGQTVTTEELNQRVWGYTGEVDNTMLKNVVYRLRRKIESDPANPLIIQTVAGVGYKLAGE
jgi:two-component system, OmpR family, KDP operon response regulator KdpE